MSALIQSWLFNHKLSALPLLPRLSTAYLRVQQALQAKPSQQADIPVISVGSLLVGGAGKTPVCAWLAQALLRLDIRAGIVSRGFRGSLQLGKVTPSMLPRLCGDEALMLARRLPEVPIVVARERFFGVQLLARTGFPLALLDDGFQHTRLARDLDIVVVPPNIEAFSPLPAGPLRESLTALERADLVWIHDPTAQSDLAVEADVVSHYRALDVVDYRTRAPIDEGRFTLLTGVARNDTVRALVPPAIEIARHLELRDHQQPSSRLLRKLADQPLLLTEKDAARFAHRLSPTHQVAVFRVELEVTHGQDTVLNAIRGVL